MNIDRRLTIVRVLLTIVAFEFFGPIFRDFGPSHALNPDWVGHARLHLVWALAFMGLSGLVNLYLIWAPSPVAVRNLRLSMVWQACNLGGFWISVILVPAYGGIVTLPETHVHIFGIDENVFAFTILTAIWLAGVALFKTANLEPNGHAAH
jgi:hypothetical protein